MQNEDWGSELMEVWVPISLTKEDLGQQFKAQILEANYLA